MRVVALVESVDHVCCRYRLAAFAPGGLPRGGRTVAAANGRVATAGTAGNVRARPSLNSWFGGGGQPVDIGSLPRYDAGPVGGGGDPDPAAREQAWRAAEASAVAAFRFWRRVMIGGWLACLPMVALGIPLGLPFPLAGLPAAAAFGIGMSRAYGFMCPRCGRCFVWRWGWQNVFTSRCVHCGYSIRAGADNSAPPA